MNKNIEFEDVIDDNTLSISPSHETLIKKALEEYANKRFGETNEKSIKYKNNLEDKIFLKKNTEALMDVSHLLYSACYAKDNEYDKINKYFLEKIQEEETEISIMKAYLIKNHENISDVSLLNDLGLSKYFKRVDKLLLQLKKYVEKI